LARYLATRRALTFAHLIMLYGYSLANLISIVVLLLLA